MIHTRHESNLSDINLFLEKQTAKKKNKEKQTLFNKFQIELERMADHFTHAHNNNLKRDKTLNKTIDSAKKYPVNYNFTLGKKQRDPDRDRDRENERQKDKQRERKSGEHNYSDLDDKRTSSLQFRQSYNSLNYDKRNLSTFRTEKEKKNEAKQKERQRQKEKERYRDRYQNKRQDINSFGLLLQQNEKLAVKVGELQTKCQVLVQNSKITKSKYKQQIKNADSRYYDQMKQRVYLQKLSYYYKNKALQYLSLLKDNGIRVENPITEESMVGEESRF